jgi:serine/threonine-protein kinase
MVIRSKYKVLDIIGQGQFGRVFAAVHRSTGELVALKELNKQQLATSKFLNEFFLQVSLSNAYVVAYKGLEHDRDNRYLVMDYCEGGTLRNLIDSCAQLSLLHSLQLIINILSCLKYVHENSIIHRDLKPENILLNLNDNGWTARISDFGIAKLEHDKRPRNMGDTGSIAYMAPEQFFDRYSYRSDVYAVGIILYEIIVGERPFSGLPKELISSHFSQPVIIPKTVPFILRSIIATALQKLPQRRFASASDMLKSVRSAKEILTLTEKNATSFFKPSISCFARSKILSGESLSQPVTNIAVASKRVYLGQSDRIISLLEEEGCLTKKVIQQWQLSADEILQQLSCQSKNCLAVIQSLKRCFLFCFPQDVFGKRSSIEASKFSQLDFSTKKLISTIDGNEDWLAIAYQNLNSNAITFEIVDLTSLKIKHSQSIKSLPDRLITIDNRYGVALFTDRSNQKTNFCMFDRRGNWLGSFSLAISIESVTFNPFFPNRLLAVETNNQDTGLAIDLKPLQVIRFPLSISPDFIVPYQYGYVLIERQGKIMMISSENDSIVQSELALWESFQVTAATNVSESLFLIATWSEVKATGKLYRIMLSASGDLI